MLRRYKTYIILLGVCVVSGIAYFVTQNQDFFQFLFAIPFVGSLVAALVQVLRDQAAHERALMLQEAGNHFVLGAGSHMGNVAFDKHVEFSAKYVKEAQAALTTLLREGPTEEALKHAWVLRDVRDEYIIWLTEDLEQSLDPFEAALREIGAGAHYVEAVRESKKDSQARSDALEAMYNKFAKVMGFNEWNGISLTDELAILALIRKLRGILGTEELTSLRTSILARAKIEIQKEGKQTKHPDG